MIDREREAKALAALTRRHRVVGIIGTRQVGKTTLARLLLKNIGGSSSCFDLENPEDLARLADPMLALKPLKGIIVIDEVQRFPEIFPVLRVLADRSRNPSHWLVLGSASPDLLRQGSETLAGRIFYKELGGFSLDEVGVKNFQRLWVRGGFPRSYLASSDSASQEWRRGFIRTFLDRDLPQLGITIPSTTLQRFWSMLAHYHGQTWNASEFGRSFGVADTTVRNYLDRLTSALVIRQLLPWHENISKRQIKSPKVYIADSVGGRRRLGFEIKLTSSPKVTSSMRIALADLKLERLFVVHAGEKTFPLERNILALAFSEVMIHLRSSLTKPGFSIKIGKTMS